MVQEKITEADTPTIRVGATPSGLISDPPPSSSIFTLDALPATTLPLYPGLGQALNMLACIPNGVVTSHSTQNRSFQRRSVQPISWCAAEETKCNRTKANNMRTKQSKLNQKNTQNAKLKQTHKNKT